MDLHALWRDQITLVSTYAAAPLDLETSIELIRTRRVPAARLISHTLPLSDAGRGFELVASGKDCLKVILKPQE
jgi:L-iditol 2-dehydrogenase